MCCSADAGFCWLISNCFRRCAMEMSSSLTSTPAKAAVSMTSLTGSSLSTFGIPTNSRQSRRPYCCCSSRRESSSSSHSLVSIRSCVTCCILAFMSWTDRYYKKKEDVLEDKELQAFAKEISVDGNGKIRRFPTSVRSVMQLRSIISRFLWIVIGRHTAVNYPLTDYVSYVPNAPTKLYNDSRAPADRFSLLNLPLRTVSETQCAFTSSLGTFRYDRLLDYASFLEDRAARRVVYRNFCRLNELVEPLLIRINNRRLKDGHLAYPYFIPRWLPNGIQT
ncbi:predicted protein [Nematostella vectensis]|uniref:Lipoxygenase domain-containing protein n=1 Tax=Nematostella vectensis TaxID=45351 RepID=A8DV88_NEMVE|nr:predicted protein [Nematostella vectensis]|eukprot:XP_001618339.1 hypothetical protein NEMVEDRAFT_v1g233852 [Nematostella vectensis]